MRRLKEVMDCLPALSYPRAGVKSYCERGGLHEGACDMQL